MLTVPPIASVPTQRLLVLVLPIFVILVAGTVYALLPADTPPPPQPNTGLLPDPDPLPPPKPGPGPLEPLVTEPTGKRRAGAPASLAEADAILREVNEKLAAVRARLELKFKVNEYMHDPAWTLEGVMRRLTVMDGTHFRASDYSLTFPDSAAPVAHIGCNTRQGAALPDGPIVMVLNLKTGESEIQGDLLARDDYDRVYLPDSVARVAADEVFRMFTADFLLRTGADAEVAARSRRWRDESELSSFTFTATVLHDSPAVVEYACREAAESQLAEPMVLRFDYGTWLLERSDCTNSAWQPEVPDRAEMADRLRWRIASVAEMAGNSLRGGVALTERTIGKAGVSQWHVLGSEFLPSDLRIVSSGTTVRVTLATSLGRPLPYAAIVYVYDTATDTGKFAD
jgi:hypothetical protein